MSTGPSAGPTEGSCEAAEIASGRDAPARLRPRAERRGARPARGGPARPGRVHRAPGADRAGERGGTPAAGDLRCAVQTARDGIRAFNARGVASLAVGSSRPRSAAPVLGEAERERPRAILHRPPRAFGHPRSTWTLDLLAREAHGQGLSPAGLPGETIRQALPRLGVGWKRAERRLTSPDPAHAQESVAATG